MEASLYMATAAQRVMDKQLEVIANNIANSNTVGYRAESVQFQQLVSSATSDQLNFPTVGDLYTSQEQGTTSETANPLDLAIVGRGYFAIQTDAGLAYTRDGRLKVSNIGELTSIEGHPILDAGGAAILLPNPDIVPEIHSDGRIEANGRVIGNIGVFDLTNEDIQSRIGNSAFLAKADPPAIVPGRETKVQQGFLENSNVVAIRELANLIQITKSFDSAFKVVEEADSTIGKSISELGRTS